MLQQQTARRIDCRKCVDNYPDLLPGNCRILDLWQMVNTQWRLGFGGVIGLDYPAVFQIAKVKRIRITPILLKKLQALELRTLSWKKEERHGG